MGVLNEKRCKRKNMCAPVLSDVSPSTLREELFGGQLISEKNTCVNIVKNRTHQLKVGVIIKGYVKRIEQGPPRSATLFGLWTMVSSFPQLF
jgi:hypothetical protein